MPQHIDQLRAARRETQEGNRTIIQENDRIIIREGGNDIIRHDEAGRFRFNAREVNVERRGNVTITIALRPDGARIVTETDETGRLLRRLRREPDGREVVIIDNSFEPRGPGALAFVVNLPAPVIRIPREVYIRETARATAEDIFLTLTAPPVERIERRYALDEIRFSEPVRERMPRVDIDTVNFETGSWEIAPDQVERLAFVAQGIKRAVQRNPREVFLVEGYTDAVGDNVDNLSLSDRRAEIGRGQFDQPVWRAGREPLHAGLRQAVPQDSNRGAGASEPPRRGAPHHAAAPRPELTCHSGAPRREGANRNPVTPKAQPPE